MATAVGETLVAKPGDAHEREARQPGVAHLYGPKWRTSRRRLSESGSLVRGVVLGIVGFIFWAVLFTILYRILAYFRATPGLGEALSLKLLSTVLLAFLPILLLSNIITALSSFFLARDLELLAAAPVDGVDLYGARLVETFVHSSWMIVLVLVPILSAYAVVFGGGPLFIGVSAVSTICFLMIPAVIGTMVTQVLVNVFPARRARDILTLVALLGAAAVVAVFRLLRPEQLARPEGFRDLVDFIAALRTPKSIWLPSEWAAQSMLTPLGITERAHDFFPLLLLASTAAALLVIGAWVHGRLFLPGLSRAHGGAEREARGVPRLFAERWLRWLPVTPRSMVAKDLRSFFRDTTQWSQLVLLAVLVIVYIYNIRVLPLFSGEDVGFLLLNVVVFLNTGLAGFVIAAIAARLVFPAVSLEGGSLWLLRSSPLKLASLVWSKYWVGVMPLLVLAVAITAGTNAILHVHGFMAWISVGTVVLMTFALASMALGFGAVYPKFNSENAADIPTSFGGLLFMMAATAFIAIVVVLEAWPVYSMLYAQMRAKPLGGAEYGSLALGLGGALIVAVAGIVVPLRIAARRIEAIEP
jgi:ABC-2 type transport system permease protein